jgi:dihydrolipoamide dehydrogenase
MADHDYDVIVIGGGTGNKVASAASGAGMRTALVEPGPIGGTCLNRGCNPSKMLIQRANVANTVRDAEQFGISAEVTDVDFQGFVREVNQELGDIAEGMKTGKQADEHLDLYEAYAEFVDSHTLQVGDEQISGDQIVVAAGSRPVVPPFDGIDEVDYLTSREAIRLETLPEELVVVGGGYIASELGYYFSSLGSDVTMIEMLDTLVPREDREVAELFTDIAGERHEVVTGYRVTSVAQENGRVSVTAENEAGDEITREGDELLVAAARRPNTDRLNVEAAGLELDDNGFIVTDEQLRTSVDGVYAQGDIADNFMFKHSADYETEVVIENVVHDAGREADFTAMPHAIFTEPQIAGVGRTEQELEDEGREYVVGRADIADTAMARAKKLEHGFAKVLADPATREILGVHVIGHDASTLIHEAVVPMRRGDATVDEIADTIHVHPSLSKVMRAAFRDVPA